jgi:hypothetical protein
MKKEIKRYILTIITCFALVLYFPTCNVTAAENIDNSIDNGINENDPKEVLDYVMDTGDIDFFIAHQNLYPSAMVSELLRANSEDWKQMVKDEEERLANLKGPAEYHLTASSGTFDGPSGKETYYNLDMSGVVSIMRSCGYDEVKFPYWVRDDGIKMLGDYVMVAASFDIRPRGTILDTSLGSAIVCDTGGFASYNQTQLDIAVIW